MIRRSTIQLLRFPFSFFLMPVYWFALSMVPETNVKNAVIIFVLLHVLLYPSSNGYNSFMDRDESSIGGVAKPMQPTKQLYYTTVVMDILAACLSFLISLPFSAAFIFYIVCSRLYSYRKIRIKRFAIAGYLTVIINQGALTFWMVYNGANAEPATPFPWIACVAAAFLIGGFYPITQVYQHKADAKDGVQTISMLLGIRGTFIFCAIMYVVAFGLLFVHFVRTQQLASFAILQVFFVPVLVYFFYWVIKVWQQASNANFKRTMQMNWLASGCTNAAFITLTILHYIG